MKSKQVLFLWEIILSIVKGILHSQQKYSVYITGSQQRNLTLAYYHYKYVLVLRLVIEQ